jgi:hypothetical protein
MSGPAGETRHAAASGATHRARADTPNSTPVAESSGRLAQRHPDLALFLVSLLALFLELMLIRWISTEIRIFAYAQNTVLVICFLGLGLGCWTCRSPSSGRDFLRAVFVLVLVLAVPFTRFGLSEISQMLSLLQDFPIWEPAIAARSLTTGLRVIVGTLLTFLVMLLICGCFLPLGRLLGRLMDDHTRPIWAYSVNVAGSLVGGWLFVLMSALQWPPAAWCAVVAVLALSLLERPRLTDVALGIGLVGLAFGAHVFPETRGWPVDVPGTITLKEILWSPYQKLHLVHVRPPGNDSGYYHVAVNNTSYMIMADLRPEGLARHADSFTPHLRGMGFYDLPLAFQARPRRMLVVGAGAGNDVAAGLRAGARRIVAVGIDPAVITFGRRYHPERPYDDSRVAIVTDDARAFFAKGTERFDLIVFGLLDAHTTTAMTNTRLDHFVYTRTRGSSQRHHPRNRRLALPLPREATCAAAILVARRRHRASLPVLDVASATPADAERRVHAALALLFSGRRIHAAGGPEHQQGGRVAGRHLGGERGHHFQHFAFHPCGQCPRRPVAEDPPGSALRQPAGDLPRAVLRQPVVV